MEDCSTDEQLRQEMFCRRQWTDVYVEHPETLMRQNVVVIWLQCLLVDVVHLTGTLAPDQVEICTPNLITDSLRHLQPVKSAEQWADVVESIQGLHS